MDCSSAAARRTNHFLFLSASQTISDFNFLFPFFYFNFLILFLILFECAGAEANTIFLNLHSAAAVDGFLASAVCSRPFFIHTFFPLGVREFFAAVVYGVASDAAALYRRFCCVCICCRRTCMASVAAALYRRFGFRRLMLLRGAFTVAALSLPILASSIFVSASTH